MLNENKCISKILTELNILTVTIISLFLAAETMPKQSKPSSSRRFSEAAKRSTEANAHQEQLPVAGLIEKPLITQLKQKIAGHQHPPAPLHTEGPSEDSHSTHHKLSHDRPEHDIMDLSVRKLSLSEGTSDWLLRKLDGVSSRFTCSHCGKIFNKESQLYLHSRVHEMETPAKADKKKAKADLRAASPSNSNGNVTATNENPRPFFCAECNVGFRIHGMCR